MWQPEGTLVCTVCLFSADRNSRVRENQEVHLRLRQSHRVYMCHSQRTHAQYLMCTFTLTLPKPDTSPLSGSRWFAPPHLPPAWSSSSCSSSSQTRGCFLAPPHLSVAPTPARETQKAHIQLNPHGIAYMNMFDSAVKS